MEDPPLPSLFFPFPPPAAGEGEKSPRRGGSTLPLCLRAGRRFSPPLQAGGGGGRGKEEEEEARRRHDFNHRRRLLRFVVVCGRSLVSLTSVAVARGLALERTQLSRFAVENRGKEGP